VVAVEGRGGGKDGSLVVVGVGVGVGVKPKASEEIQQRRRTATKKDKQVYEVSGQDSPVRPTP